MIDNQDLRDFERATYHDSYSNGIADIYIGMSLLWIGIAWIWLPGVAGVAGALPAILIGPMLAIRKRFSERRIGHVEWTRPRRQWEHRNLRWALLLGTAFLLLGLGALVFSKDSPADADVLGNLSPGLIAWLLGLVATGLAFLRSVWRMLAYGTVLMAGGVWTSLASANAGWPLLVGGTVVAATGVAILMRFTRSNPVVDQP